MSVKVAQKIIQVMNSVSYLKKDGNVNFKSTNYNYLSEEKVTSAISKARAEIGLLILPIKVDAHRDGSNSSVVVTYAIMDAESGEKIEVQMAGQGSDSQDKGIAKALTQCFKYIQRQSFGIPTGDDPDHVSSAELDEQEKVRKKKQEEANKKLEDNILKLWKEMKGDAEGLKEWVDKKLQEKKSLLQMNDILQSKLNAMKKGEQTS